MSNKKDRTSNFHFIYNTQMDMYKYLELTTREQRAIVHALVSAAEDLKKNFKDYIRCESPKDKQTIDVAKYTAALEFGSNKKDKKNADGKKRRHLLHVDGFIGFDKYCKLDFNKIAELFNNHLAAFEIRGFFNARLVPDTVQNAVNYSKKEGMVIAS